MGTMHLRAARLDFGAVEASRPRPATARSAAAVSIVPPDLLMTIAPQRSSVMVGIDAGVLQELEEILEGVVIDVVPLEVDPRLAHAQLRGHLVVVGVAQGVEECPRPEVAAADAEDDDAVDVLAQPVGDADDLAEFARVLLAAEGVEESSAAGR